MEEPTKCITPSDEDKAGPVKCECPACEKERSLHGALGELHFKLATALKQIELLRSIVASLESERASWKASNEKHSARVIELELRTNAYISEGAKLRSQLSRVEEISRMFEQRSIKLADELDKLTDDIYKKFGISHKQFHICPKCKTETTWDNNNHVFRCSLCRVQCLYVVQGSTPLSIIESLIVKLQAALPAKTSSPDRYKLFRDYLRSHDISDEVANDLINFLVDTKATIILDGISLGVIQRK